MAEDQGKEEEKFDFTPEGEARAYISLAQARVLAMSTARDTPGEYGRRFRNVAMVFETVESSEDEDYYTVTLSFRPQGAFSGVPGQEQFFIEKEGDVAHRQVLSVPGSGRRLPFVPAAIGVVVVGVIAAVAAVITIGVSGGDSAIVQLPAQTLAPVLIPTVAPTIASQIQVPTPNLKPTTTPTVIIKPALPVTTAVAPANTSVFTTRFLLNRFNADQSIKRGQAVFAAKGCVACHTIQGVPGAVGQIGPELTSIATIAGSRKPGMSARAYISESIENPPLFVVDGFTPLMPSTIRDAMSDAEFNDLVAFLLHAPDFEFTLYQGEAVIGGPTLRLSELWGKPVVLNFWAGLLPTSRAEMPELQKFYDENEDQLTVLGIDLGQFTGLGVAQDAEALLQALGVTYPAGITKDASVIEDYSVLGMPTTVFINCGGQIVSIWGGALKLDILREKTDRMLRRYQYDLC